LRQLLYSNVMNKGNNKSSKPDEIVGISDILDARHRINQVLPTTPLTYAAILSELAGRDVYLKWDNKFRTGSFKERGAVNFLYSLNAKEKKQGVCAASAGNHALALSYHAARLKLPCSIVMPVNAPLIKVQSCQSTGVEVILHGDSFDEAYQYALSLAEQQKQIFVSAFDHERIIAGQGTAGLEILEQCPGMDSIIVPVGGGGLISGVATALKHHNPEIFVLGVQSEWIIEKRRNLSSSDSLSSGSRSLADGIAVKTIGKLTRPIIEAKVDKLVSISEKAIANSIIKLLELERAVVEGAGAAGIGALLANHLPQKCQKTVVMVCGSNIDMNVLSRLIERDMGERGRLLRASVSVPDRPGSLHLVTGILSNGGANVLQVRHDRSFSESPDNVDISLLVEVRNAAHRDELLNEFTQKKIKYRIY